jgi:hypothetical protein
MKGKLLSAIVVIWMVFWALKRQAGELFCEKLISKDI